MLHSDSNTMVHDSKDSRIIPDVVDQNNEVPVAASSATKSNSTYINNYINNFIMGTTTPTTSTNASTTTQQNAQRRDSSSMYPPFLKNGQRNDSISMFTNFNLPRFSTDASITPFLNIAETGTGTNDQLAQLNENAKRQSQDFSEITRGFSIVNGNMWTQQQIPPLANQFPNQNKNINTNHIDPIDGAPKFKPLSFSAGKSNSNQFPPRSESFSIPPSNKTPNLFNTGDNQDIDFLNQRGSIGQNMKPPTILPTTTALPGGKLQALGIPGNQSGSNLALDNFFSGNSRKPSLSTEFDFDSKRRNSSIKLLLDNPSQAHTQAQAQTNQINFNPNSQQHIGFPPTLSRLSSMINVMKNDPQTNAMNSNTPAMNTIMENKSNEETTKKNNEQVIMDNFNQRSNEPVLVSLTKKRILKSGIEEEEEDTFDNGKKLKQQKVSDLKDTNVLHAVSSKSKLLLDLKHGKKLHKKTKDSKINKKSSFDDVLKKITKDSNLEESITKDNLMKDTNTDSRDLVGVTKIDQLMLMIDARKKGVTEKVETSEDGMLLINKDSNILPRTNEIVGGVEKPIGSHGVKEHECKICHRFFTQLTHLEVHIRSHIGFKPFECQYCKKRFTQGGNLRTHLRLHTGEKPYECEFCKKRFSRKGNLAAHYLTHKKIKPFVCKLDNCNKTFTQLGNMKAHQNRFHLKALSELTERLAKLDPNKIIDDQERQMLDYFASLYKNSNKGIKGRGKSSNPSLNSVNIIKNTSIEQMETTQMLHNNELTSASYQLYQGHPQQPQQPLMKESLSNDPNLATDIEGHLSMNFQDPQRRSQDQHIPLTLTHNEFVSNDDQNNELLNQNGVEFKFVNYKK